MGRQTSLVARWRLVSKHAETVEKHPTGEKQSRGIAVDDQQGKLELKIMTCASGLGSKGGLFSRVYGANFEPRRLGDLQTVASFLHLSSNVKRSVCLSQSGMQPTSMPPFQNPSTSQIPFNPQLAGGLPFDPGPASRPTTSSGSGLSKYFPCHQKKKKKTETFGVLGRCML